MKLLFCLLLSFVSVLGQKEKYSGTIQGGGSYGIVGTVTVIDDNTFEVSGFSVRGTPPDAYWWGASSVNALASGFRINDEKLGGNFQGETRRYTLLPGQSFANINALSVWCELFAVDLGNVELRAPVVVEENGQNVTKSAVEASITGTPGNGNSPGGENSSVSQLKAPLVGAVLVALTAVFVI